MARAPHANCATGILDGAPHGATKRVRGVPKWPEPPCELRHWDLRWSSLYGAAKRVRHVPKLPEPPMRTAPLGP
eukprot:2438051-Pyramimonas_sp.AAC.1